MTDHRIGEDQEFLRECLGGDWSWEEDEEEGSNHGHNDEKGFIAMNDESDDEAEYEDDWDHAKLSELMQARGATEAELVEAIEQAMAQALERRLHLQSLPPVVPPGQDNPYVEWTCEGDIGGRMTPENTGFPSEDVDDRFRGAQAKAAAKVRGYSRRSSIVRAEKISEAMQAAKARHRRSTDFSEASQAAYRRHRMSVAKAAEVIMAAEPQDEDQALEDNKTVAEQMALVQQAMEQARRRHRRSVAEAVKTVTQVPSEAVTSKVASDAVQDRIQLAIAAAYQRRCGGSVEALTSQQAAQEKIQQAMAAASQRNAGDLSANADWSQSPGYSEVSQSYADQCHADQGYTDSSQAYGQSSSHYGQSSSHYGQSSSHYGQSSAQYVQSHPQYDQSAAHYDHHDASSFGYAASSDPWANSAGWSSSTTVWGCEVPQRSAAGHWPAAWGSA